MWYLIKLNNKLILKLNPEFSWQTESYDPEVQELMSNALLNSSFSKILTFYPDFDIKVNSHDCKCAHHWENMSYGHLEPSWIGPSQLGWNVEGP